jgi:hypothetical protein
MWREKDLLLMNPKYEFESPDGKGIVVRDATSFCF